MTLRLLSFICTVTAASIVASCGGGVMSGGADAQKGKKSAESDEDATDPQVIAGAYLTCDYTSEANTEVGCNLGKGGTNITPTKSERIDYVAQTGTTEVAPTSHNASYNAVFSGLKNISTTTFLARLYRNSTKVSEWSCDGSKLPCKPVITRGANLQLTGLNGFWEGTNTEHYTIGKQYTILGEQTVNPAPADDFCDSSGKPYVNLSKVQAAASIVGVLSNSFTPPKPHIESTLPRPYCVRKINDALIRYGSNCSVVVFKPTRNSNAHDVLVYPKEMSQTSKDQIAGLTVCN